MLHFLRVTDLNATSAEAAGFAHRSAADVRWAVGVRAVDEASAVAELSAHRPPRAVVCEDLAAGRDRTAALIAVCFTLRAAGASTPAVAF